jgi:crotonobetainyl-CoA hydratase
VTQSSSASSILIDHVGRITILSMDRPQVANALHPMAHEEMSRAIDAFIADDEQWVLVITGVGERAFCAGMDLKFRVSHGRQPLPITGFGGLVLRPPLLKPIIAAVNGVALGGGFELALACDMIVASSNASFALPEVKQGLAAMAGGLVRLPRAIGPRRAMELALTGRCLSAEEAVALGLVSRLVPPDRALEGALELAGELLTSAPLALRATKDVILRSMDEPDIATALERQNDYASVLKMRASEDAAEGPRAFAEKRPPRWRGR